ncbi:MAG: hypothetical protein C4523_17370 [Myxococcales bacterium]|nr:MAG: hypothetical protein C4523_17370 [Myxococcales bacterium]
MSEKLAKLILKHRLLFLIVLVIATAFFAYQWKNVRVESPTIDLFPATHPYVQTFVKYKDVFGGATTVLIALEVKEGDIFQTATLEKVKRITKELELLDAINNYQVLSLAQRKVKELRVDPINGFVSRTLMWPDVPQTPEEVQDLRERVYSSPRYFGTLVSHDSKAALVVAGFFEDKFDPKKTYDSIESILDKERDANTEIFTIGRPIMLGYILSEYPVIFWLFGGSVVLMLLVLIFYFRDLRGTLIPLTNAILAAIWGIGFLGLLGYNFDPLVLVIPFIISERALSHSVQFVERFLEEFEQQKDRQVAVTRSFKGLLVPGLTGILTDAVGVLLILSTPIPLLQKLAVMGGFWVLSIVLTDFVFNPILLSYLPAPRWSRKARQGVVYHLLARVGSWASGWQRWAIFAGTAVVLAIGWTFASDLVIGDVHPGTPMLWPDSKYNQDTDRIGKRFGNTEIFSVIVEGKARDSIKNPEVLRTMTAFQRHMETLPEVASASSIADYLPGIISILHGSDPKWELIPDDPQEAGFFLEMIYSNAEPGDLTRFVTIDSQNAAITLYLRDHKGETLRKVVEEAKAFIAANPMQEAQFRLAGGYGGLLAAINEVVHIHQAQITALAFGAIFLFCSVAYRSFWAGLFFLLPIIVSNFLTYALMGARQIGLDVNALPVVALGVGLGVDYGLYIVERIKNEYQRSLDLNQAVVVGVTTAGKAVTFTALMMIAGVSLWATSFLRFQADMGLLLVFWMVVAMLGSLLLLPALIVLIKPKFVVGKAR